MSCIRKSLEYIVLLTGILTAAEGVGMAKDLSNPTSSSLPLWHGFNLLEKFMVGHQGPFVETDFQWIQELGFNFVRLPMDYRCWIVDKDWRRFNESVLQEIDQAVAWGQKYNIHVCLNFHRAPGYTVAQPAEEKDLWTDEEAQEVCALHWATFARRYKGIPSSALSFNLFNEPSNVDEKVHAQVVGKMVAAIHGEDLDRLIIADGLVWGTKPGWDLIPMGVAQATRGYEPGRLTHYQASWSGFADAKIPPTWPLVSSPPAHLYGPMKPKGHGPLELKGKFPKDTEILVTVGVISSRGTLAIQAGKDKIFEESWVCGPGEGPWKTVVYKEEWKCYQNIFDLEVSARVKKSASKISLTMTEGDWMTVKEIRIRPWPEAPGGEVCILTDIGPWEQKPPVIKIDPQGSLAISGDDPYDRKRLRHTMIEPWRKLEKKGVGVMVGEFGSFNRTPHDVTLAWMRDCLENWKDAGWGWALWNFRGSFGILDSGRTDVSYESWRGHELDRAMLSLLQECQQER